MKTSDPQEHFLTVMKNGKFGIFRAQTTYDSMRKILEESYDFDESQTSLRAIYADNLDLYFASVIRVEQTEFLLSGVKVKLSYWSGEELWIKATKLDWITWIVDKSSDYIVEILNEVAIEFRVLIYTDGSLSILSRNEDSSVSIVYSKDREIDCVHHEFYRRDNYTQLKELRSFNIPNL